MPAPLNHGELNLPLAKTRCMLESAARSRPAAALAAMAKEAG